MCAHNVPFLTLAKHQAELFTLNATVGTFTAVALNGFFFSYYLIVSYMCLGLLLHAHRTPSIATLLVVLLHALILVAGILSFYASLWVGLFLEFLFDGILTGIAVSIVRTGTAKPR